jgi:hypothetical protein
LITRRDLLEHFALVGVLPHLAEIDLSLADSPPVRAITRPPGNHWFGYYDKHEFDPTDRFVFGMRTALEGRTPRADDELELGKVVIDSPHGGDGRQLWLIDASEIVT